MGRHMSPLSDWRARGSTVRLGAWGLSLCAKRRSSGNYHSWLRGSKERWPTNQRAHEGRVRHCRPQRPCFSVGPYWHLDRGMFSALGPAHCDNTKHPTTEKQQTSLPLPLPAHSTPLHGHIYATTSARECRAVAMPRQQCPLPGRLELTGWAPEELAQSEQVAQGWLKS